MTAAACGDPGGDITGTTEQAISNACFVGAPTIMDHPVVINVYWTTSLGQWDVDVANDPIGPVDSTGTPQSAGVTVERIDGMMSALFHSGYFDKMGQYGMQTVLLGPNVASGAGPTPCPPPPANLTKARAKVGDLVKCVLANNPWIPPKDALLNILVPPQIPRATDNDDFCPPDGGTYANHDNFDETAAAFIPIYCNRKLWRLINAITHEDVEAISDRTPSATCGWKIPGGDEIADLCDEFGWSYNGQFMTYGMVSPYWSNDGAVCTQGFADANKNGFNDVAAPEFDSVSVCGAGQRMKVAIKGELGGVPWDLQTAGSPASSTTRYLSLQINPLSRSGWSAGDIGASPADHVNLGLIQWEPGAPGDADAVTINGFDDRYGEPVPDHWIAITMTSGGPLGAAAFTYQIDGNTPIDVNDTTPNANQNYRWKVPGTAATVTFAPGTYVAGSTYTFSPAGGLVTGGGAIATVSIAGLHDRYVVAPGDALQVSVTSVATGQTSLAFLTVPPPAHMTELSYTATAANGAAQPGWIFFGKPAAITGKVLDAGGCPEQAIDTNLLADEQLATTTSASGWFSLPFHSLVAAGKVPAWVWYEPDLPPVSPNAVVPVHALLDDLVASGSNTSVSGGTVDGGQHVTLIGIGFATNKTDLVLRDGAGHEAVVTGQSYAPGAIDFVTPKWTWSPGPVDLVARIDGVESNPLTYLYVVPEQPVLTVLPPACAGLPDQLQVTAYGANGEALQKQVTLTAPSAIFVDPSGAAVALVKVQTGAVVDFVLNAGPQVTVTATALGAPPLITELQLVPGSKCGQLVHLYPYVVFDPAGPVESGALVPAVSPDGSALGWALPGEVPLATASAPVGIASRYAVSAVGAAELHALTRGGGFARLTTARSTTSAPPVALTGAGLLVTAPTAADPALTLAFAIPDGTDAAACALLHRDATGTWNQVATSVDGRTGKLTALVGEGGVYALARVK